MNPDLLLETEKLTRSWAQYEATWLRSYLVAGVEDPRINLQSILSRHFLIHALGQNRWDVLMAQEYRFASVMNWLSGVTDITEAELRAAILHALRNRSDNAEGLEIPHYVLQTFEALPAEVDVCAIPNYVEQFLLSPERSTNQAEASEPELDTFCRLWNGQLEAHFPLKIAVERSNRASCRSSAQVDEGPVPPLLSLVEPACGSANDYRFVHSYGLARLLDYTGFDLCQTNIENARVLFPGVRFETGNVFEISAPPKAFDLCVVHDLFEHLSLSGLEQAVREVCRVTRRGICVGFFQMDEIPEHIVRPRDDYYWNLLSLPRMRELFASEGFYGQAIHIGSFLSHHAGCQQTYNPNAYTFVLEAR